MFLTRLRRRTPWLVLLCVVSLLGRAAAEDGPPARLSDVKAAFLAAADSEARATALLRLRDRAADKQLRILRQWLRNHEAEPARAAALVRAMHGLDREVAARSLKATLARKGAVRSRVALLRLAMDMPELAGEKLIKAQRNVAISALEGALAHFVADPDGEEAPDLKDTYGALTALHGATRIDPNREPRWERALPAIDALDKRDRALLKKLMPRILGGLPPPTEAQLGRLPKWMVQPYAHLLLPAAMARALAAMSLPELRKVTARMRRERVPRLVRALVRALGLLPSWSHERREVYATLLDLSGADIPDDPDFWRSWWAGNEKRLVALGTLPSKRTLATAVARGVNALLLTQAPDGSFAYVTSTRRPRPPGGGKRATSMMDYGATALAVFALRSAGVPGDAWPMRKALRYLRGGGAEMRLASASYTYGISLAIMAMQACDPKGLYDDIQRLAHRLIAGQHAQHLGWTYQSYGGTGAGRARNIDLSNTQYAILGLRRATMAGQPVPAETWERVQKLMREAESDASGEWLYSYPNENARTRSGMAAIAAASFVIAGKLLDPNVKRADMLADAQVDRALRTMANRYGRKADYSSLDLYTMYSIERVGALYGIAAFDGLPWHEAAEASLLERQNGDGSWGRDPVKWFTSWGRTADTAYALLILRKATTPVFSGGLNVPADPGKPIHDFNRLPKLVALPPSAETPSGAAARPLPIEARMAAERALASVRDRTVGALWQAFARSDLPIDRLALAEEIRTLDPYSLRAQLYCGYGLVRGGKFVQFGDLRAALPLGALSSYVAAEIAAVHRRAAERAYQTGSRHPPGSPIRAALWQWLGQHAPDLVEQKMSAPGGVVTSNRLDANMLRKARAGAADPPAEVSVVDEETPVEKAEGVSHQHVRSAHFWVDAPEDIEDLPGIVRRAEADLRVLAWLVGVNDVDAVEVLRKPIRIVAHADRFHAALPKDARTEMLAGRCRELIEVTADTPESLQRVLRNKLLPQFLPALMGAESGPPTMATSALKETLYELLVRDNLRQPRAAMKRYGTSAIDGRLIATAMGMSTGRSGAKRDVNADPRLTALAHDTVHWLLVYGRVQGIPLLRSLWGGASFSTAARSWPGGADVLARSIAEHLEKLEAK